MQQHELVIMIVVYTIVDKLHNSLSFSHFVDKFYTVDLSLKHEFLNFLVLTSCFTIYKVSKAHFFSKTKCFIQSKFNPLSTLHFKCWKYISSKYVQNFKKYSMI